jgi:hypothetical protein
MKKGSLLKGGMLLIAFAIVALCLPVGVSAAPIDDWNISGTTQFQTFRYKADDDRKNNLAYWGVNDPYKYTQWDLNTYTSNLNFSATSGDVTGCVEIRPKTDSYLRLFYAKWNFGVGDLTIGQAWTPLNMFYSNQVGQDWASMIGYGAMWELRKPLIQVKIDGLKLALVKPNTPKLYSRAWDGAKYVGVTGDTHANMPKAESSYTLGLGPIVLDLYGGYNQYQLTLDNAYQKKETLKIKAWVYGAGVTANLGPLKASASGYKARNGGVMGIGEDTNLATYSMPDITATNDLINCDSMGLLAVVSYVVIPQITLEAGWGQLTSKMDERSRNYALDDGWYQKQKVMAYYIQAKIMFAKNVYITPEFAVIDYGDEAQDPKYLAYWASPKEPKGGKEYYYGAQWEIKF